MSIGLRKSAPQMATNHHHRPPVSTRHAFALAFDLAVRRDPVQSIVVPLLLHAPWILALALLPSTDESDRPGRTFLLNNVALLGDFIVQLTVGAMLRFRARSVYNTAPQIHPAPVLECYARGIWRMPWLLVTEVVRNFLIVFATFFFVIPAVFLGFRLSLATEAVVLSERDMPGAFIRSFQLTEGRFERWLEMMAVSVIIGLAAIFTAVLGCVIVGRAEVSNVVAASQLAVAAITPIIQYAWTFFYLRLVEWEGAPGIEVGPAYAAAGSAAPASAEPVGVALVPEAEPSGASPALAPEPYEVSKPGGSVS